MNLDCIREQINTIDSQLVELLEKTNGVGRPSYSL